MPSPSSTTFDAAAFRGRFPFFRENPSCVWLDSAATSHVPDPVLSALALAAGTLHSSVHRSLHSPGAAATRAYENARARVADFLRVPDPSSLVFTSGATHALNLAARVLVRPSLAPGDVLLVSPSAHHSLLLPLRCAADEARASLLPLPLDPLLRVDPSAIPSLARSRRVPWIAVDWISNVTGAPSDLPAIAAAARSVGARLLVDAAQGVAQLPPDVPASGADAFAFSGHKMHAPTGIGALWARPELLENAPPLFLGGEMVSSVSPSSFSPAPPPLRFEAGTPNFSGALALAAAADFLSALPPAAREHAAALAALARRRLAALPSVRILSSPASRSILTFTLDSVHPHDVAQILDASSIAIRAGFLCAEPFVRSLADGPVLRASFSPACLPSDVDRLLDALQSARALLS